LCGVCDGPVSETVCDIGESDNSCVIEGMKVQLYEALMALSLFATADLLEAGICATYCGGVAYI
jgi:hypothetical protein